MVWNLDRMVEETFARGAKAIPAGAANVPPLLPEGQIPAGTLILSGTPEGVAFRPPTGRQIFLGAMEAVFLLHWAEARQRLAEPAIREARREKRYLQPGDEVVMYAPRLGWVRNQIAR